MNKIIILASLSLILALVCAVQAQNQEQCSALSVKPNPEAQKFSFKSCIVAQLSAYLIDEHGKYINFEKGVVNQNSSRCENATTSETPMLVVNFECANLSISINRTNDSKTYVSLLAGSYKITNETTIHTFTNSTGQFFTTQTGHYYKCNAEQLVPVGKNQTIVLSNFAFEAYRDASGTDFYRLPEDCLQDSQPVSDLVRIGVGICLVALVAIVLVAYFVGRRRWSERSSYESV